MEYYTPMKNNAILPYKTKWYQLESIMLNKISQYKKDKYHIFSDIDQQLYKIQNINKDMCIHVNS